MIVTIISTRRPLNVPIMEGLCDGLQPTWIVGTDDDVAEYRYAGAERVVLGGGLCKSRNLALDLAAQAEDHSLQLSDDLVKVEQANGTTRADVEPITMAKAVAWMQAVALAHPQAHLIGVAPTANPYFSKDRVHKTAFVVGDMILVRRGCPVRFDLNLRLKEDYDYTCQHLQMYGEVARIDNLLASFLHRKNRGGAVHVRTPQLEQETIAYLMSKWPKVIRPNPRRPNEVLLRWPK